MGGKITWRIEGVPKSEQIYFIKCFRGGGGGGGQNCFQEGRNAPFPSRNPLEKLCLDFKFILWHSHAQARAVQITVVILLEYF